MTVGIRTNEHCDRLILALDVPTMEDGKRLVARLSSTVQFYKIGLEAYAAGFGEELRDEVGSWDFGVFVDLKIHDIAETVRRAVLSLAYRADFVTVHGTQQVMASAAQAVRDASSVLKRDQHCELKILGVTVLTSLSDSDLTEDGYPKDVKVQDLVRRRAEKAQALGVHGVIASPQEAKLIRSVTSQDFLIVCPGVRPAGASAGDQKRIATPYQTILDGADYLVVGRPIRDAADPVAVAKSITDDITKALSDRIQ